MFTRFCRSVIVAVAVAAFTMSVVGHAQTASPPPTSAASPVVSAWHAQFGKNWTPPKTPWGDPDLQGNFTWVDEVGTPRERPAEFEGRGLTSITQAEMDNLNLKAQVENTQEEVGGTGGGATRHWYEYGEYRKNSTPWAVLEPADGKRPPLTPEASAKTAQPLETGSWSDKGQNPDTYTVWDNDDRCISGDGGPLGQFHPGVHGNSGFIVQTPDYVLIQEEELLATRVIPIKGRKADHGRLPYKLRPYWGDSLAWFEGNTLVVETVYHAKSSDVEGAPPETSRTTERFTRRTDPAGIQYTATVENPTWWVRPWTWQERITEDDRQVAFEYACHETNYSIVNTLAGARDKEQRDAERAKRAAERAAQGK